MSQVEKRCTPLELYHDIWSRVSLGFIDERRLVAWNDWEHYFDKKIVTKQDAVACVSTMLNSLGDRYTKLVNTSVPVQPGSESNSVVWNSWLSRGKIGYLNISTFAAENLVDLVEHELTHIKHARAFIVDLRGNSGGNVGDTTSIAALFLNDGPLSLHHQRSREFGLIERRTWLSPAYLHENMSCEHGFVPQAQFYVRRRNLTGNKPLVLLVNEYSASAAELFAGILRDNNRAFIIGTPTAGKGTCQTRYDVGDGWQLHLTDSYVLPPSGQFWGDDKQSIYNGLVPDMILGTGSSCDYQLVAAVNYILNKPQVYRAIQI